MPRTPRDERVVVTGMGWVTPLGSDLEEVWLRLLAGECAPGPVTHFPASTFATNFAAEVRGFDLSHHLADADRYGEAHRNSRFALAAAAGAWKGAGLGDPARSRVHDARSAGLEPRRVGVYLGAGEGTPDFDGFAGANLEGWDASARATDGKRWGEAAHRLLSPAREVEQEPHMPVTHVAQAFGCVGPAFNCMTACAASTQAIGEAFEIIRRGDADMMLAGGTHSMIHPLGMTGFIRLTAMSRRREDPRRASRPFDATRDGFVMGEGAGVVVLERLSHALRRGAKPLAEVAGYGSSADAYRITDIQPEGIGAVAAMRRALEQAGIDPRGADGGGRPLVHYISAHGTGTKENDSIETKAVRRLFGERAPGVPFSSIKSMMGHLIQAAGAVELITCVRAIETGMAPPTMNLETPDPLCDLDYVANKARDLRGAGGVEVAMSNSFGFGGQNDCVVVRRYRDQG